MVDLSDVSNDINLNDINHVQTSEIIYKHLCETRSKLNLKPNHHIGICTDAAANVSSLNAGVAGKVLYFYFYFYVFYFHFFVFFFIFLSFFFIFFSFLFIFLSFLSFFFSLFVFFMEQINPKKTNSQNHWYIQKNS